MVEFDKIKFTELKKVVMAANTSGVLTSNIRHVGVKGVKLYDAFISAIGDLDADDQLKLPEEVIDFFNYAIDDEDEPEEAPELDFEEGPTPEDEEPELEPEEIEEGAEIDDEPLEEEPPKVEHEPEEPISEPDKTPNLDEKPKAKMKRLSKTPMMAKVEDSVLTIAFKELDVSKSFDLPSKEDVDTFKSIRKEAMNFAKDNGASKGQIAAISKTLNLAGYYIR